MSFYILQKKTLFQRCSSLRTITEIFAVGPCCAGGCNIVATPHVRTAVMLALLTVGNLKGRGRPLLVSLYHVSSQILQIQAWHHKRHVSLSSKESRVTNTL
jgi:hypothetical protein